MKIKNFYLVSFIIGTIMPYWQFGNFLLENGFNMSLFFKQLFANRVSAFFAYDVIISIIITVVFIIYNKKDINKYWTAILATILIGVSSGLPLFLYLKSSQEEKTI